MNKRNRFTGPLALAAVVAVPILTNACSEDALCCNEFKVGATVSADIGGSAQAQVAVQAVADFSGIASAAIDDITGACRSMAQDLDATKAEQDAAEGNADKKAKMDAWCKLAVKVIGTVKAGATLTVNATAPKCEASVSAKANCQAKCSGSAQCDVKANPPTCEGGKLEVACKGECTAKAGATLSCEGSCSAECKGSCEATGGVKCNGKCEGTCEGTGGAGSSGVDASGKCTGTCKGTCEVTAPGVKCEGSCKGECKGSCTGSATASVKCDGECKADFEPLKCSGGELKGGCKAEAKCEGNCDASVKAKAECTPPSVEVTFSGGANAQGLAKLKATLEANLGIVISFKARLDGMAKAAGVIGANADAVADIKAVCIPVVVSAGAAAVENVTASVQASGSIITTVGAK